MWTNLCLEGGGVKGIGLAGSACYMDDIGIWKDLQRFCGTSAGSIFAILAVLDYTPAEIKDIMFSVDFNLFKDKHSYFRKCRNFIGKFGIYSGEFFEQWIEDVIFKKMGIHNATFEDLKHYTEKRLFVTVGNISTGYSETLCCEVTPNVPLAKAVRMSMAIPFYFTAVQHPFHVLTDENKLELKNCIFCDGGVFQNYPIQYFDDEKYCKVDEHGDCFNPETIGFKLDSRSKIDILLNHNYPYFKKIKNVIGYTEELIDALMNVQDNYYRTSEDWKRTIFIDTLGINTTDFDLTMKQKKELFDSGYAGARTFFLQKGICK